MFFRLGWQTRQDLFNQLKKKKLNYNKGYKTVKFKALEGAVSSISMANNVLYMFVQFVETSLENFKKILENYLKPCFSSELNLLSVSTAIKYCIMISVIFETTK